MTPRLQVSGGQGSFLENLGKKIGAMLSKERMLYASLSELVEGVHKTISQNMTCCKAADSENSVFC